MNENFSLFSEIKHFLIIPVRLLLSIEDLELILKETMNQSFRFKRVFQIDALFTEAFSKVLEVQLLQENIGKFEEASSPKSIFLLDRKLFKRYWMSNAAIDVKELKEKSFDKAFIMG